LFLPGDRLAKIAADQLRNATGRDVTITGDVSMTLWPVIGASVDGLEVGNAEWSEQGPMLSAQNAALGLDARALLSGEIKITHIEANAPTIRLESRQDGRASWQFSDAEGTAQIATSTSPDQAPQAVSIARLAVTNARLIYAAEGSDTLEYSGVDLTLDWPERTGPAQIDAVIRPAGQPVTVSANVAAFDRFIAGDAQVVGVSLSTSGGSARLQGQGALSGAVSGRLSLQTDNTDGFLKALGLPGAALPAGLGRMLNVTTDLQLSADRQLALRDLNADLGGNTVAGRADIALNGVPQIDATLQVGALDLTGATGGGSDAGSGAGGTTAAGSGWSKTAIDASGLAAFNGTIAVTASSVDLGSLKFGASRATLRNDRARMVFALQEVAAYGGRISGEFVMNNRNGLSVGGKLNGAGLQVQELLRDAAGITRLTGAAEARLAFLGVGQSMDEIMRSLSGDGALNIGRGTIEGIDLDQLMRSGDGSGGTTVFDSLGATYTMQDGVLRNSDLLALLANFEARGTGQIGIGTQTIDYLFTPKSLRGNSGRGLAIPVRIRGPWADPSILPDLEAAIDLNLAEEKKEIEEKVKTEVQREVEKALDVSPEEGQSVEDALEKKLEDEVGKRLRRLFD